MSDHVAEKDGQTEVRFTHLGFVPDYECYDNCRTAWGFYVSSSLQNLITTGEGLPNGRGRPRLPSEEEAAARGR